MNIQRQKELVEVFHYDIRNTEEEHKTELKVSFLPLKPKEEGFPEENTILGARIEFLVVLDKCLISGRVSQINHIINEKIESPQNLSQDQVDEIVRPLLEIIQRLTQEVTEITFDEPGVKLNFAPEKRDAE
ncbi:hypothetical protein M2139_002470 [Enterococcus sp. PF1-24]|uniref:DUF1149 family protein n=1 Tax=unclassified Enterococcus TaxID=2608891 RepID=UPI0024762CAA|nr:MULTISPECIES: DUF1149 family protein [unclassified Enterococcus]MDH6365480.1 hypothetical protein [Enterococcus sp. PFB1-1]MDH6402566.1 hypothetical protein [Enterococcus sp. PF1-24]